MKNTSVVLGLYFVVLLALAAHRSVAGEATGNYHGLWLCQNVPIEKTAYFAAIFEATADRGLVVQSFKQVLAAKYGYHGEVNCGVGTGTGAADLAKAKEDRARYVKQLHGMQIKVHETGWTYAGASATAPAPATSNAPVASVAPVATAATAPQGPTKLWVCRGNTNAPSRDMYITKPFPVTDGLANWRNTQAALGSYMQAHYKPTAMNCDNYATQAEADARVEWLVNWAHTYKFDPVSVSFTYP
ncbi:MAG TPA: hypothetical protein VE046_01785 [Steroidobacteraceae bacterium]|nr:hypothetical protein [Steroidobacteraceae bacterium]